MRRAPVASREAFTRHFKTFSTCVKTSKVRFEIRNYECSAVQSEIEELKCM
jgi:hypothetical protein